MRGLRVLWNRQANCQTRAPLWPSNDFHRAIEVADPFGDTTQPEALSARGAVYADAVVLDHDVQPIIPGRDVDSDGSGARMTCAVGQRFLDDTIHAGSVRLGQRVHIAFGVQVDRDGV